MSNRTTGCGNTSLNVRWCRVEARQGSFPLSQKFKNGFHALTMGRGGDFQQGRSEIDLKDTGGPLKEDL